VLYLPTVLGNKEQCVKNKATVSVSYLIRQNFFYLCELFIYKTPKRNSSTYSMIWVLLLWWRCQNIHVS